MTTDRLRCRRRPTLAGVVWLLASAAACASPSDAGGDPSAAATQAAAPAQMRVIQHEVPTRDFVGPAPTEFRWSPVHGADRYSIGLWNETDRLLWRNDDITTPQVAMPTDLYLDSGTYFWSVSALQNNREVARSGMAAFVIED